MHQELYLLAARYGHVFSGEARWGWLQTRGPPLRRDARQFGSSLFYFRGWLRLMGRRRVKWKDFGPSVLWMFDVGRLSRCCLIVYTLSPGIQGRSAFYIQVSTVSGPKPT